ncbi:MAG: hypothetical protein K2K28_02115 [Clostridia bacterium]|nr:hypothetical protein [Clostridia bacterium]
MKDWFLGLSALEHVYFWLGVVATVFLIVQIIILCCTSFGGDVDIDGDGDIDVDSDSGVSIFTVKSITAFLAVGGWAGLLTCAVASDKLQWLSVFVAVIAGAAAMAVVVVAMRAMLKLQSNGAVQHEKLVGKQATVYVSIPAARSGRGKITLTAQGRFLELDAMTDEGEKIAVDETVEIISTENECAVVTRAIKTAPESQENKEDTPAADEKESDGE